MCPDEEFEGDTEGAYIKYAMRERPKKDNIWAQIGTPQGGNMKTSTITINSWQSVVISGVRTMIDFSSDEVIVRLRRGNITIAGNDLKIEYFDTQEICISGKIFSVMND